MAESSVTIPDVEVVIDFCLTKNIKSDPATNYIKLKLEWADGNSSTQVLKSISLSESLSKMYTTLNFFLSGEVVVVGLVLVIK